MGHFTTFISKISIQESDIAINIKGLEKHIERINLANSVMGINHVDTKCLFIQDLPTVLCSKAPSGADNVTVNGLECKIPSLATQLTIDNTGLELCEGENYVRTRITITDNIEIFCASIPKPEFGTVSLYLPNENINRVDFQPNIKSLAAKKISMDILCLAREQHVDEVIMKHEDIICETTWGNFCGIKFCGDSWEWHFAPNELRLIGITELLLIEAIDKLYADKIYFTGVNQRNMINFDLFTITSGIKMLKVVERINDTTFDFEVASKKFIRLFEELI